MNEVYNIDILELLKNTQDNSIDLIYSDPDYNVGINYNENNYTKSFEEYMEWYIELAKESFRVLKDEGNMFFINYPKQNAYLRVNYLDKICFDVFEYVWVYNTNVGHSPRKFTTAHRNILHCTKTKRNKWFKDNVAEPYQNPTDKRIIKNMENGSKGRMPYSWLYYDLVKNVSKDKTFHSCQIPVGLVEKLFLASTNENDIIFVHFGGSGNEIFTAKRLNRRFISAEIDKKYYEMIKERLDLNGQLPDKYKLFKKNYENNIEQITIFDKLKEKINKNEK